MQEKTQKTHAAAFHGTSKKKLTEKKEPAAPAVIRLFATYPKEAPAMQRDRRTRASSKAGHPLACTRFGWREALSQSSDPRASKLAQTTDQGKGPAGTPM